MEKASRLAGLMFDLALVLFLLFSIVFCYSLIGAGLLLQRWMAYYG